MTVKCKICGIEKDMSIVEHVKYSHNMTTSEYKKIIMIHLLRVTNIQKNNPKEWLKIGKTMNTVISYQKFIKNPITSLNLRKKCRKNLKKFINEKCKNIKR